MGPIIIIGSGLGGLAFAQGLHKAGIPFKVYERDRLDSVRAQGYRIRLHGEGLHALRSVCSDTVWDLFEETCAETVLGPLPFINPVTCEFAAANFGGNNPQGKIKASGEKPYTVDRAVLRDVLTTGLHDYISYGKEYSHYTLSDDGVTVHFSDGTSDSGALLVGADGVRSAVRRQYLPHLRVLDTKTRPLYGKTPLTPAFKSRILPKAMDCLSLIKDPKTGSTTLMEVIRFLPKEKRNDKRELPNDYVYWVMIPPGGSNPYTDEQLNGLGKDQLAELANSLVSHWDSSLRPLIEDQDPNVTGVFRLLSSDPTSLKQPWEPSSRITVIGDAAHAMMPSTASGAVTALRDADALSTLIRDQGVSKQVIAKYESEMREYASEAVALSAKIGEMSFALSPLAQSDEVRWGQPQKTL
jgi:2-polyprenyl-6-methoxyphenol hydroxylase-like FAD-dependent oxidoreductase